ncbi:hypothetical protein ElyMa_001553900 [Elysia marginata]|uniref:Beta-lactamase-related domain-containing protein n=1 Tax=Elysia marginata TaxID=1093978 RepID=A0AAV4JD15_9GAST|nr:hypothetical protein ElyMa_001553900 [Elysia marginata]
MATSSDVAKWLRHLIQNLQAEGSDSGINMLIGDAFAHSVTAPERHKRNLSNLTHNSEATLGFGMGWEVSEYKGRKRYMYSGHLYAYASHIWLFPDSRTAVYVVVNGHTSHSANAVENHETISLALRGILYQVSDIIHGERPWVKAKDVCRLAGIEEEKDYSEEDEDYYMMMDEGVTPVKETVNYPLPLDAYKGSYAHGLVEDLVVDFDDQAGLLTVKLGRNLQGELRPKPGTSNKLLLKTVGWLRDTFEWLEEKVVEFLPATVSTSGGGPEQFQVARLYLTNKLYYDFERGKMFSTMLVQAEEEKIRKAKEEEERIIREEKEAQMKQEAARKAREEAEKRRREEKEKKEMMAAVAREKAAEEARKEEERKAMKAAVAREKAEEAKQNTGKDIHGQAAALEETGNRNTGKEEVTTGHSKANLVKKGDNLGNHQSHQPYHENGDNTELEVLPPNKVTDNDRRKTERAKVNDKDGVGSGPTGSACMLTLAVCVVLIQTIIYRH